MAKYRFGDICKVLNGRAYKQNELLASGKYPILRVGNFFSSDRWYYSDMELPEDKYCDYEDLLFAWSASFGPKIWDGEKVIYHYHIWKLIPNDDIADKWYLYYWLRHSVNRLTAGTHGSVMAHMTKGDMENQSIELPSLQTQRKISSILRTIDEKIHNNVAINNNLEQQAQALFKSWFVDFEPFGGVQPSEMQFIPLQELCKVVTKGTTPTTLGKSFTSSGINFIKAESILNNHSIDSSKFAFIDEETNALLKRSVIKVNDIIFTIAGTLGRFAMVDNSVLPANTNQAVAIIRPDETKITPAYLYSFFIGNWHNEYYSKRIQQAVQANLSLTTIKSLPIAVLNNTTMSNYDKLVSPLFALMKNNEEENRKLSKLRDALLPKLMSGELDVSGIDL